MSRVDNCEVLVLSEFAGAAVELRGGALLANPYDDEKLAATLGVALRMDEVEQRMRMERMRHHIWQHDVFHWFHHSNACKTHAEVSELLETRLHIWKCGEL